MSTAITHWRLVLVSVLLAGGAVLVGGGYAEGWSWTGLSGDVALWDWLEALALPLTVGLLPVLLLRRDRLTSRHRVIALSGLAVFAALVLAGYLIPWHWTGFTGNTLWDWLELALLPVVLATATLWPKPDELHPRHWALIGAAATAFLVIVLAGYLVPWAWTGFSDNKAWDWVKLLLLPVLVPTVLLPALQQILEPSADPEPRAATESRTAQE
jgi:hypothetical protein